MKNTIIIFCFVVFLSSCNSSIKKNPTSIANQSTESRCIEFMRPGQIQDVVNSSSVVFIPISPLYEWHSFHLPLGTDGIIAEESAKAMAEKFNACYFRCLPIGLDRTRSEKEKKKWGFTPEENVFGMNFPGLPLESEYNTSDDMRKIMVSRLKAIKNSGFKAAVIINHHGGFGQNPTLKEIANEWSTDEFKVIHVVVTRNNKYHPPKPEFLYLKVGGHAGLSETHQLMAFRPDLVDLSTQPEGELNVKDTGILHRDSIIPDMFNPRHAKQEFADKWRESVLTNMEIDIRKRLDK